VVLARTEARRRDAAPLPSAIAPIVQFRRLPTRARRTVLEVLDDDPQFRRRVADGAREADLDRASWLFLTRPDGWQEELDLLAAAWQEEHQGAAEARREQSAQRRAEQLEAALEKAREDSAASDERAVAAERETAGLRERHARTSAERDELRARAEELDEARARAVRELKQAETNAARRLDELRSARRQLDELQQRVHEMEASAPTEPEPTEPAPTEPAPTGPEPADVDLAAVAAAVTDAASAAAALGEALSTAAGLLASVRDGHAAAPAPGAAGTEAGATEAARASTAGTRAGRSGARPPRRTPLRLRGGRRDDEPDGVRQLLDEPGLVVFVDGYNVSMLGWPQLDVADQRESLVRALGGLQSRAAASVHVVFDGDDDGRRPSVAARLPVRVHFSSAEVEADDLILDMVRRLPTDVAVLVVSADRRVAEGARRLGANVAGSSVLLELLRR
jgi:hypothetical protein